MRTFPESKKRIVSQRWYLFRERKPLIGRMVHSGVKYQGKTATSGEIFSSCRLYFVEKGKTTGKRTENSIVAATVFPITNNRHPKRSKSRWRLSLVCVPWFCAFWETDTGCGSCPSGCSYQPAWPGIHPHRPPGLFGTSPRQDIL